MKWQVGLQPNCFNSRLPAAVKCILMLQVFGNSERQLRLPSPLGMADASCDGRTIYNEGCLVSNCATSGVIAMHIGAAPRTVKRVLCVPAA